MLTGSSMTVHSMQAHRLKRSRVGEEVRQAPLPLLSVLAPVDLSPISDRVLARVAQLPLGSEATITLLHVVPAGLTVREERSSVREAKKALLGEVSHLARSLPRSVSIEPVVTVGAPATEIAVWADRSGAELVVMGRCARRPLREALLGSTAERVVRRARVPVLVVQLPARRAYRHPALALDLDEAALPAVEMLLRVMQQPRVPVTLIHAFVDLYRGMVYAHLSPEEVEERQRELRLQASEQLMQRVGDALAHAHVAPEHAPIWATHIRHGSARSVIEKVVKNVEPDLLVLGSHGYTGLAHLFLGTVAGDVLREVSCDVLVVPPHRPGR